MLYWSTVKVSHCVIMIVYTGYIRYIHFTSVPGAARASAHACSAADATYPFSKVSQSVHATAVFSQHDSLFHQILLNVLEPILALKLDQHAN